MSGVLGQLLQEENVFLGGASMGKGLKKAAVHYLEKRGANANNPLLKLPGASMLAEECNPTPNEEPFYIVDLGVLVSQVYQCTSSIGIPRLFNPI